MPPSLTLLKTIFQHGLFNSINIFRKGHGVYVIQVDFTHEEMFVCFSWYMCIFFAESWYMCIEDKMKPKNLCTA